MKDEVDYEWDVEVLDEYGDIVDHHFQESFRDCVMENNGKDCYFEIVLVRTTGNQEDGVTDRTWAYVNENGELPEYSSTPDINGKYINKCNKIPKKFHQEIAKFKKDFNAAEFWRTNIYRNYPEF